MKGETMNNVFRLVFKNESDMRAFIKENYDVIRSGNYITVGDEYGLKFIVEN